MTPPKSAGRKYVVVEQHFEYHATSPTTVTLKVVKRGTLRDCEDFARDRIRIMPEDLWEKQGAK